MEYFFVIIDAFVVLLVGRLLATNGYDNTLLSAIHQAKNLIVGLKFYQTEYFYMQIKDLFLLDADVVYLNHGSFGATPRPVFEVYQDWQNKLERQPVLFLARELQGYLKYARESLGAYLNAVPDDLVCIPNATTGVNIIARSLNLRPGDEILTTDHEYGACERAWKFICRKTGASLIKQKISLPVRDEQEIIAQLWQGITDRTRLIFISHITSPTALTFPVGKICAQARQAGILTLVDGAHAPGQISVNLLAIGADFYAGNCHKWMMAPKGSAFLFARPERQKFVEPLVVSWGWEAESTFTTGSQFIDYLQTWGTWDPAAILSVPAAIQFQIDYRWDEIKRDCHEMVCGVVDQMAEITGMESIYPKTNSFYHQMAALPLPVDVDAFHFKDYLYNRERIEIPCYLWEGRPYVRISVQGYNTKQDIDNFLNAVKRYLTLVRDNII